MNNRQKTITILLSVLFAFLLTVPMALAEETVDTNTSEDEVVTSETVQSETGVYYTVKKGDTLWDLSKRFNDKAWSWPSMWNDNKELLNPHQIYPGQKLKLFRKADIENIKTIRKIAEKQQETIEVEIPETDEKNLESVETVDINESQEVNQKDTAPIELPSYKYSRINQVGFMLKETIKSQGYIFKVRGDAKIMIYKGDEVYIQETGDIPLTPGAKYTLYRTMSPKYIERRLAEKSKIFARKVEELLGIQHYLTGVVMITGKKSGYAVGKIVNSYRDIMVDDMLTPYSERSPEITLSASVEGLDGMIIAAEEEQVMMGDGSVAFIDKGTEQGVQTGQIYNVYYPEEKETAWLSKHKDLFLPIDFASILVLHTEPTTSTILVTNSYKSVSPGDKFHYPTE